MGRKEVLEKYKKALKGKTIKNREFFIEFILEGEEKPRKPKMKGG